ncbi:MAG TPA: SIS domain-containing protein [Gaiellaceae bacterium]|nr:SIS domain-containing protein [Gaiellaceae bacterium]
MSPSEAQAAASRPGEEERGARFLAEIREQPAALERLLARSGEIASAAAEMRRRGAALVRMVGHGSSDNAASYGVYAFGLLPGWTAVRDSISLIVYYGASLDLRGCTVLALSQSGRTPDVVEHVRRARRRGALTVALTNDAGSELAAAADVCLPLDAGPERAVAATKTYTNQLAALFLLAAHAAGEGGRAEDDLRATAALLRGLVAEVERTVAPAALPFAFAGRMFVVGRGCELATAKEIALKLLETCRIAAEPLTATELVHGPVAALDPLFPVWAIASGDETLPAVLDAVARARAAGATLVASGSAAELVEGADLVLPVPRPPRPLLSPLLSVVPGQLFAWALSRARGLDPDAPRGLSKVTLAR